MENIKYILYARKSSEDKNRQIQSIDDQIKILKDLAIQQNLNIVEVLTESKSAKAPDKRPEFSKMINMIENGKANGILCWKLDRLFRNPIDGGKISWLSQKAVIEIIKTPEKNYLPQDNVLMIGLEGCMANQFILDLSRNVKRGSKSKAEKGWRPGSAPLGYKNDMLNHTIIKDESRFDLVRKMWELLLTGTCNPSQIVDIANNKWGFITPSKKNGGNRKLAYSTIYWMFNNPFYYGRFEYPIGSGNWYQGKHESMITEEEFNRTQEILNNKSKPKSYIHDFAFTGIIKCGNCGCAVTADEKIKMVKSINSKKKYIYYHCTHKRKNISCCEKPIKVEDLEQQIVKELDRYTLPKQWTDWCIEVLKAQNNNEQLLRDQELAMLTNQYNTLQQKQKILLDLRLNNQINDSDFIDRKKEFEKESLSIKDKLDNFQNHINNWINLINTAFNFISLAKITFIGGFSHIKRDILTSFCKEITLKNGKIKIIPNDWLIPMGKLKTEFLEKSSNLAENTAFANESARTNNKIGSKRHNANLYPSLSVGQGR